jgi:uncharacterized protein
MAVIPRVLKNFNLYVDGRGYAGRVSELTLPKLSRKMEEFRGGGMNAPVELDMGMEKLECEFTLKEFSEDVLKLWGVVDHAGASVRFKGALEADDAQGTVTPVEIIVRGRWREIDGGNWKAGEDTSLKVSVACSYYRYESDGAVLIEIDVPNMIEIINGADRLEAIRAAIGE